MGKFSADFEERCCDLDRVLGAGRSYDVICRALCIGGRRAKLWVIDGFGQDAVLERITLLRFPSCSSLSQRLFVCYLPSPII